MAEAARKATGTLAGVPASRLSAVAGVDRLDIDDLMHTIKLLACPALFQVSALVFPLMSLSLASLILKSVCPARTGGRGFGDDAVDAGSFELAEPLTLRHTLLKGHVLRSE